MIFIHVVNTIMNQVYTEHTLKESRCVRLIELVDVELTLTLIDSQLFVPADQVSNQDAH